MSLTDLARLFTGAKPPVPADGTRAHRVTITIGSDTVDGWIDYDIIASMVTPADGFRLTRPFDLEVWKACKLDQSVKVAIDGVVIVDGFIDDRGRRAMAGTMEIAGRDKSGRLVQESVPKVSGWDGLKLDELVRQLAAPWYTSVTLSDARNRLVRRGKGHRAIGNDDAAVFSVKGKLDEEHAGRIDPAQSRWSVIEQLCSSVGVLVWSSADGRELVIGQPNYSQAIQYLFAHRRVEPTIKDLIFAESILDSYALIEVHGSGAATGDEDYGEDVTSYVGTAKDGPNADGTGRLFLRPKRLVVTNGSVASNADAKRAAEREMTRRAFKRRQCTVIAPYHGQIVTGSQMTLFAPNTLARVIDEEMESDEIWMPYACHYRGSRDTGETTEINLVPRGTEFVA